MKSLLYGLSASLILLSLQSCSKTNQKSNNDALVQQQESNDIRITNSQFNHLKMQLGRAQKKSFPEVIETTGIIDVPPKNRAVVTSFMGGYIKNSPLLVGDEVKKGQAVVTLENPAYVQLQQQFLEITEQLVYLKSEYERQQQLMKENINSEKNLLKSQSDFKSANATSNALKKQLQLLGINPDQVLQGNLTATRSLVAPIGGKITKVNAVKGSFVTPTDEILEIIDNSHLHLELSVFEKDVLKLKKNQSIYFSAPQSSNQTYEASVYLIGSSIDENSRIRVHAHLREEQKQQLLAGMFVEAKILVQSNDNSPYFSLPEESIIEVEGNPQILVLKNQTAEEYVFEPIAIKTYERYNGYTQVVLPEAKLNAQVLVKGAFSIIPNP